MVIAMSTKSKSPKSAEKQDNQAGRVSLVDLELAIETERIFNILDHTIHKLELVVCLPLLLLNNGELLSPHLKKEEMSQVFEACTPYIEESEEFELGTNEAGKSIGKDESTKEKPNFNRTLSWDSSYFRQSKSSDKSIGKREDPNICRIIQLLWDKISVRNLIKDLSAEISPVATTFLEQLKQLQVSAMERLSISPYQEHAREQYLRRLWHHNEHVKAEISLLSVQMEEQNKDLQLKLVAKNLLINQHEAKIERINKKCKDDIRKRVYDSERKMVTDWKDSEMQQDLLSSDVKDLEAKMKSLLNTHLAQERELRAKRLKVEMQLISWLNKYDADIGDKQAEYDEVLAGFEDEKRQMEELQEQFDTQQDEYERLMQEKADEEQAILEQKMYVFICNRSARRIQRYWRAYRARKLARRKGRRKRKGGGDSGKGKKGSGKKK